MNLIRHSCRKNKKISESSLIKRALLCSLFTLLMSITMFVGTSYAWFTDTASVSVKKIQAGNLNVEIQDENGNSINTLKWVDSNGNEIQDQDSILWEPGSTYNLQSIKIVNKGDLALKYKIVISGINTDTKSNNVVELNDAITWTIELDKQTFNPDTEYKLKTNEYNVLSISGTMDDNASNDYQGLSIDNISISILATQDTVEYDSEENQYDKDAEYPGYVSKISANQSYIGKYADVDGDGTVDGVIFADLAFSGSGTWGDNWGSWSYSANTDLKQYYVSQTSYVDDFGTVDVIAPVSGTTGNERFYVMALDDADSSSHYWYYSAYSTKITDQVITSSSDSDFGTGKARTATMISAWNNETYGIKNGDSSYTDMWGAIQTQTNNGWFVPSKTEWAAFGSAFSITSSNYSSFGLSLYYWSSSLCDTYHAYYVLFGSGYMGSGHLNSNNYVRLATTF